MHSKKLKILLIVKTLLNPGKIVRPLKSNDRSLMRYKSGYQAEKINTHYDWSELGSIVRCCGNVQ